jgi:hypothetical protein
MRAEEVTLGNLLDHDLTRDIVTETASHTVAQAHSENNCRDGLRAP